MWIFYDKVLDKKPPEELISEFKKRIEWFFLGCKNSKPLLQLYN